MRYRRIDLREAANNPDLDLIGDYLMNELDPEQVADVRRRLEDDPAFRDFAAPIIAFWNAGREAPPQVPREQLEAEWDAIRKRAKLVAEQRQRRRLLWIGGALTTLVALALAIFAFLDRPVPGVPAPQPSVADTNSLYGVVPDSGHEMTLMSGVRVRLERGATLRVPTSSTSGFTTVVQLEGTATFALPLPAPRSHSLSGPIWIVRTRAGVVTAMGTPTFRVAAHGDSTTVSVSREPITPARAFTAVLLGPDPTTAQQTTQRRPLVVKPGETARIVRRQLAIRLAP